MENNFGLSSQEKAKAKPPLKYIIPSTIVIITIIVIIIKSGVFLNNTNKILNSFKKTFNEDLLFSELNTSDILKDANYTLNINGEIKNARYDSLISGSSAKLTYQQNPSKKKVSLNGTVSVPGITDLNFSSYLDNTQLLFQAPEISDNIFSYNYINDISDGFLTEKLGKSTVKNLNDFMISFSDSFSKSTSYSSDIKKTLLDNLNKLNYEEISKKNCTVNEEAHSCIGYTTTVSYSEIRNTLSDCAEIYDFYYKDLSNEASLLINELTDYSQVTTNPFIYLKQEFMGIPDIDVSVYIYKDKIAELVFSILGNELVIDFKGGDYRTQNFTIEANNYYSDPMFYIEKTASTKDGTENATVSYNDYHNTYELNYDYTKKSGIFDLKAGNSSSKFIYADGILTSNSKKMELTLNSLEIADKGELAFSLIVEKGSNISAPKGDIFDIGKATNTEVNNVMSKMNKGISKNLYSLFEEIGGLI